MNYGRRTRDKKREERPFAKDWKNESLKEGGSSLVQQAGMALGALAALVAERLGMSAPAAVVLGSFTATTVAIAGKGFVAATVNAIDRRKERRRHSGNGREGRLAAATSNIPALAGPSPDEGLAGRGSLEGVGVGGVISAIGGTMSQLEVAATQLADTANRMRATQETLAALLSGARGGTVIQQMLIAGHKHVRDCVNLVQHTHRDLQVYLHEI